MLEIIFAIIAVAGALIAVGANIYMAIAGKRYEKARRHQLSQELDAQAKAAPMPPQQEKSFGHKAES